MVRVSLPVLGRSSSKLLSLVCFKADERVHLIVGFVIEKAL